MKMLIIGTMECEMNKQPTDALLVELSRGHCGRPNVGGGERKGGREDITVPVEEHMDDTLTRQLPQGACKI